MKVYLLDDIAKDVRICLDQNMVSDALSEIGDVDTLALDEIIRSKIVEGVRRVHSTAPAHLLDGGYTFADEIYWKDGNAGWVLLPENFMRFVVFEMDDWARPVFTVMDTDSTEYLLQSSRFRGIRGTAQKPLCFIAIRPEGRVLEFYSCKSTDATISRAVYLSYPVIDENGGIEICERCYGAAVYAIASLVLTSFGDAEKGAVLSELANSSLI